MSSIKVRAKFKNDITTVKAIIKHPMETGRRINRNTGDFVAAHLVTEVVASYQGKRIMRADWGPGVSKNPYVAIKFRGGAVGDKIQISWVDNRGNRDSQEAIITRGD